MSKWQKIRIGDLCKSVSNTYHGDDKEIILINTSDVLNGEILNHKKVSNTNLKGQFKKTFQQDDILYSEIRPANKRFAYIDFSDTSQYIASTKLMVLRPDKNKVLPKFLYMILKSDYVIEELQYLAETRSGTFPQITFSSELAPMQVMLPDFDTQEKIISILSYIENKIQLNKNINQNLEQQALLFFSALIEGHEKNGCLGDYCVMKSGYAFKSSWWIDHGIKVIKIGSINQDALDLSSCSYVSQDKINFATDFIVQGGDLLIAMTGATIGKFAIVPYTNEPLLVNQRVGKFFLGDNPLENLPFLYCQLKQNDIYHEIINRGQGSAQPNISPADIMSIPCVMPDKEEIVSFNRMTRSMFDTIIRNQHQNIVLSELRDTLLPRLMSGELDASAINI